MKTGGTYYGRPIPPSYGTQWITGGVFTPNEARELLGMPPLDVTRLHSKEREFALHDGRIVRETCDYCKRRRVNLTDNCLGCGAP